MLLAAMTIRNFKGVGDEKCFVPIDKIVVLIGRNNSGKSTVLDAYEAFAAGPKELTLSEFHAANKEFKPVEIEALFRDVTEKDEEALGKKWAYDDANFGRCVRCRYIWEKPGEKGKKQAYDPDQKKFVDGGLGGWDTLLKSRLPEPIRIKPTDPMELTQTKIVAMLKEYVKSALKADSSKTKSALEQIEALAQEVFNDSKSVFDDVAGRIATSVSEVFPGTTVELVPRSKDIDEKLIGAESFLQIGTPGSGAVPLAVQGTGLQRTLLWAALSVMSSNGKKKKVDDAPPKILLIDEPEAFLHPPTIRGAREALYEFALKNADWQVIATTHSPVFIDLAKDHTTIVRVGSGDDQRYVSTDEVSFSPDERERLKMVRACNPVVNEFFFYENIVLVEGPTEQIALGAIAKELGVEVHIIDCLGKGNIPLFARILNKFKVPYTVIHDSDAPKALRKGKPVANGAWTLNETIRSACAQGGSNVIFTQVPHFEGEFLGEQLSSGKVDRVLELLSDKSTFEYKQLHKSYEAVLKRDPVSVLTTSEASFGAKVAAYMKALRLDTHALWS